MNSARPWLFILGLVVAAGLAYLARDLVYDRIVLPLAYLVWQLRGLLGGVAQLIQWGIVVVVLTLIMAWQLVPRSVAPGRRLARVPARAGQVHATAVCLARARSSNYFRWQLAHRLGSAARELGWLPASAPGMGGASGPFLEYMDAGLNHSFVDYARPRLFLRPPAAGPLSLDPAEVVQYLESRIEQGGGLHGENS